MRGLRLLSEAARWRFATPLGALPLLLVAAASGAPGDGYTASAAPALVKPSTSRTYTIQLRNEAASVSRAQRARIGIAAGFVVSGVTATTSAAGSCVAATWIADGTLIADGRINLKRPGGGLANELCPGATLTVGFTAVAPSSDGTRAWTTELLRNEAFALVGAQPVVRVDGTPPVTTIGSAPDDPTNSRSATIVFSADEVGSAFECSLDGVAFASCSSPVNLSALADGAHAFRVRATDAAGNIESSPRLHSWTVDVTSPDTTIVSGPPSATSSDFANFAFAATEAGATFECALDAAGFAPCTSPASYGDASEGAHVFRVRATDAAGNVDATPVAHNWTVDGTPPQTTILGGPANPTNITSAVFLFSAGDVAASFDCRLDGAAFAACASPAIYAALADGVHVFEVRARDAAGNTDASPASFTWTVDTDAPEATIEDAPFDPSNVAGATFTFSSDETGAAFQCSLDGEQFVPCTTPRSYVNLADGGHTFQVLAADTAGNVGVAATHAWSIGTVAPLTTIDSKPEDPTASVSAAFTFSAAAGATFECALDGAGFEPCSSPQSYSGLANGEHRFLVRATEPANAPGSPAGYAWHVDTVPPGVAIDAAPPLLTNATTAGFVFSASEPGATFLCRLDGGVFAGCTSPKAYSALTHGEHTFAVRAVDRAGNESPIAAHAWNVDLVAPQTTVGSSPPARTSSTSASFAFTSSEAGSTFQCRLDSGSFLPCATPKAYPSLAEGPHVFEVRATDAAGNTDPTPGSHEWTVDTTRPETTIDSGPNDPAKSQNASFTFSSSEPGSTFECRLDAGSFAPCGSPASFSGLTEGPHTFEVRASDDVGNVDPSAAAFTWTVDTTPPDTTVLSHPAILTSSGSPAFTFSASEPGSTFECKLDTFAFAACSAPAMYSGLTEGSHTFQVRATDEAGNTDATAAAFSWTVDTTAPDTSITVEPSNPTKSREASFQFDSTQAGSSFECSLDGVSANCSSPVQYIGLTEGTHTFDVRATDPAGNADATPATRTWRIDLTAPETTIDVAPANPTNESSPSFSFSANENGSTFECSVDGGPFAVCTSPATYGPLPEGAHTFRVQATDPVGNTDASAAERSWTTDLTAPETTIGTAPAVLVKSASAEFGFSSGEPGSIFQCSLDAAAFAACASPRSYSGLAEGQHIFRVRAIDPAGNTDASPADHVWTIDLTAPQTAIDATPENPTNDRAATFKFSSSESGATFECKLDAGAFTSCSSPKSYADLPDGSHSFSVRATDAAGNVDATPSVFTWTVDVTGPQTTIDSAPLDPTSNLTATFTFSASEPGSTFECRLDGASFSACTSPKSYSGLAEGSHTFRVRATDTTHNTDGSPAAYTWFVDVTPPQTTILSSPSTPTNDPTPSFGFSSTEPGSTFECSIDGAAFAACVSPQTYPALADGAHSFQVRARDSAGNGDATPDSRTWTIDTVVPETTITSGPADRTKNVGATLVFSASDPGSTFECRLDGASFAACVSPVSYANLPDGVHTFRVRATDSAGNVDGSAAIRTWTIDLTAPQTTIVTAPADPTNDRNPSFTFSSDEAGATFECKLDGGNVLPCTSPKSYSGLGEGSHTFEVLATDVVGNVDATPARHAWRIDVTAPQTTLGSVPADPTNTTTASITFSANEVGSTFECRLDGIGAFLPCTSPAVFNDLGDGPHTFNVRATDRAGNTDPTPAAHTWTVETRAPGTTITSGPPVLAGSKSATFTFTADEPATFQCSLDRAAFADCKSPASYPALTDGPHTFDVRARDTAGNVDLTPASRGWTIDTVPPDTVITSTPPPTVENGSATFTFTATEGGVRFECALDGAAFGGCVAPLVLDDLPDGSHTLQVRAWDVVGNVDPTPSAHVWTVARPTPPAPPVPGVPPAAPDRTAPADVSNLRIVAGDSIVSITWRLPRDTDLDHVGVTRITPGKTIRAAAVYNALGAGFTDRGLTNGRRYRYRIATHDRAGNASPGIEVAAAPKARLYAPARGATLITAPTLRWQPVSRAIYYNVQLWRVTTAGQAATAKPVKVLSAWPSTARIQLSRSWKFEGRTFTLLPGRYRWYVWPGLGKRTAKRYGPLLGESSFTVKVKAAKT